MNKRIFAMPSLTYAYKGRDVLNSAGISCDVIRLTGRETKKGCRYGVTVYAADYNRAYDELMRAGTVFTQVP